MPVVECNGCGQPTSAGKQINGKPYCITCYHTDSTKPGEQNMVEHTLSEHIITEHTIKIVKRTYPPYVQYVLEVNRNKIDRYNTREEARIVAENLREALEKGG